MLVASYREKFPELDVDSIHAVFQLFKPEHETLAAMAAYDLIVIEEISQISATTFDRLVRVWSAVDRIPALVFLGDFAQLRGMEPTRATDGYHWRDVHRLQLHTMRRCKCETLKWKLQLLRTAKPSVQQLKDIKKNRKAPSWRVRQDLDLPHIMEDPPSEARIVAVFKETPTTTFVTITKAGAAWINELAISAFFPEQNPLAVVRGDPESNPDNYAGTTMRYNVPSYIPVFPGLRVVLTRNLNKAGSPLR